MDGRVCVSPLRGFHVSAGRKWRLVGVGQWHFMCEWAFARCVGGSVGDRLKVWVIEGCGRSDAETVNGPFDSLEDAVSFAVHRCRALWPSLVEEFGCHPLDQCP